MQNVTLGVTRSGSFGLFTGGFQAMPFDQLDLPQDLDTVRALARRWRFEFVESETDDEVVRGMVEIQSLREAVAKEVL